MDKKNIFIIVIAAISVLAVVLVCFSFCITHKIESDSKNAQTKVADSAALSEVKQKEPLLPSRPEDYGMIAIDENNAPRTQAEWDDLLSGKIKEAKAMLSPEENKKMIAVIEEAPKKTAEKMKLIDEGIKKCNEALKANPNDQKIKDKLARYMMLKTIGKELAKE